MRKISLPPWLLANLRRITTYLCEQGLSITHRRMVQKFLVVAFALSGALYLGAYATRPNVELAISSAEIRHIEGQLYIAAVKPNLSFVHNFAGDSSRATGISSLRLKENGNYIGPDGALHATIKSEGGGSYSHWGKQLYFSPSDGSDPRDSANSYSLEGIASVATWIDSIFLTAATCLLVYLLVYNPVIQSLVFGRHSIAIAVCVFCILFMGVRWEYWSTGIIVGITPDSGSYSIPAMQMINGETPTFDWRTPGYPLFLYLVAKLGLGWIGLALCQQALIFAAGLLTIFGHWSWRPYLAVPSAVVSFGFTSFGGMRSLEVSIMSDALYMPLLIFGFASALLAVSRRSTGWMWLASAFFGAVIATRPAGLFLVPIAMFLSVIAWRIQLRRLALFSFAPCLFVILVACLYNQITVGKFRLTSIGVATFAGATALFWEESTEYPEHLNFVVNDMRACLVSDDARKITQTWDPIELFEAFLNNYNPSTYVCAPRGFNKAYQNAKEKLSREDSTSTVGPSSTPRFDINQMYSGLSTISKFAIAEHPVLYLKFIWSNLYTYLWHNNNRDYDFHHQLPYIYTSTVEFLGTRAAPIPRNPNWPTDLFGDEFRVFEPPASTRPISTQVSTRLDSIRTSLFMNRVAIVLATIATILVLLRLPRQQYRDGPGLFVVTLYASMIGSALLVSLSSMSLLRYSYVTHFFSLSIVLMFVPTAVEFLRSIVDRVIRGAKAISSV